jgi:hypothetical protein
VRRFAAPNGVQFALFKVALLFAVSLPLPVPTSLAQDTRKVTEPHFPAPCATLVASVVADHGVISADDERRLDTDRIQHAIDNCAAGKAVVPRNGGQKNVSLSGPITLRSGVTLIALLMPEASLRHSQNTIQTRTPASFSTGAH